MDLRHFPRGKSPSWDDLTNEVFKQYSNILKRPHFWCFNIVGILVVCFKREDCGLIKLVPNMASLEWFHQLQPISFMEGLYKIFTKDLTNKLQRYLPKLIHLVQYSFFEGRNILLDVINVQMAVDCARHTHQELIMVQLVLKRAYYHDNWSFVSRFMYTMGRLTIHVSP